MPTYQFEAMDATGQEIKDVIEAASRGRSPGDDPADGLLRHEDRRQEAEEGGRRQGQGRQESAASPSAASAARCSPPSPGSSPSCRTPACRFCAACEFSKQQCKPGRLKNCLIDVCDEIEGGATLSEAMAKCAQGLRPPLRQHDQGRRGGRCAWKSFSQRLAEFQERAQSLKRKVKGAMVYPVVVISVAVGILTFIMIKIVPAFEKIFDDFGAELPADDRSC